MSFRGEVREFMREMRLAFIKQEMIVKSQERMSEVLVQERKDLLDRLMARNFPELQTYATTEYSKDPILDFDQDDNLAGAIVDRENEEG